MGGKDWSDQNWNGNVGKVDREYIDVETKREGAKKNYGPGDLKQAY